MRTGKLAKSGRGSWRASSIPFLFLFPAFIGLFVFKFVPIVVSFTESMYRASFRIGGKQFVGFGNYADLFADPVFWNSMRVTLLLNAILNPLQIVLAFLLALMLNLKLKKIGLFRAIHIIPISVSAPIAVIMWSVMLNQEQGIVNSLLTWIGLEAQPFYASAGQALWVIVLIACWKGVGYLCIFLLAGLQEVPETLYESSSIDGANKWIQLTRITLPMMKRPLIFVTVTATAANFLLFAPVYLLTQGGPQGSTNTLMNESYFSAFVYADMGRASSIVVVLLAVTLCIIAVQFRFLRAEH